MSNFSRTTFCTLPWSSIQINPSGNFKICCFSGNDGNHGIGTDELGQPMNILTHSISDALNSNLHKELRLAQSRNERHPVCRVCWDRELAHARQMSESQYEVGSSSVVSHRMARTFEQLADKPGAVNMADADKMMQPDGSINNLPIHLDIRFSNLCNSKCLQCEPQYSNLWYADHVVLNRTDEFNVGHMKYKIFRDSNGKLTSDLPKWHDSPVWWSQFDEIKARLTDIYVVGGEPFVQPAHDEMLDRLIAAGLAENITLEYDTNLTVINNKILERLNKFKRIRLAVSLDDTEDRYELIRYPCKWERLMENLGRLKGLYNVEDLRISMCIGTISIFAPSRVIPLFRSLGHNMFPIRLLRSPICYDLAFLPPEIKTKIIERYDSIDLEDRYKGSIIGYLKNNLNRHTPAACENQLRSFVARMDTLDGLRNTDWRATLPDVVELLSEHYRGRLGELK